MTARSLALRLLRYIGISSLDPEENEASGLKPGLHEHDLDEVAACITAALQEVFADAPSSLSEQAQGGVLRPPASISFDATQYSTTGSSVTGYASWMKGCTVRVGGDTLDNRIVSTSATTEIGVDVAIVGETLVFKHPTGAPTPTTDSAIIYQGQTLTISNTESISAGVEGYDYEYTITFYEDFPGDLTAGDSIYTAERGLTLMRPYMGSTGAVTATIYADCIPLASNVVSVMEPIELPNNIRLSMAASAEEFRLWNGASNSSQPGYTAGSYGMMNKSVAEPMIAFVESVYDPDSATLPLMLRFNPMPGIAYPITYRVKIQPPTITTADIDDGDHTTDPATVLPVNWVESILLPYALQRWTAHPSFNQSGDQLREIARQYQKAKIALENMRPQISRTRGHWAQG